MTTLAPNPTTATPTPTITDRAVLLVPDLAPARWWDQARAPLPRYVQGPLNAGRWTIAALWQHLFVRARNRRTSVFIARTVYRLVVVLVAGLCAMVAAVTGVVLGAVHVAARGGRWVLDRWYRSQGWTPPGSDNPWPALASTNRALDAAMAIAIRHATVDEARSVLRSLDPEQVEALAEHMIVAAPPGSAAHAWVEGLPPQRAVRLARDPLATVMAALERSPQAPEPPPPARVSTVPPYPDRADPIAVTTWRVRRRRRPRVWVIRAVMVTGVGLVTFGLMMTTATYLGVVPVPPTGSELEERIAERRVERRADIERRYQPLLERNTTWEGGS